jgi:6-phosphogluconolactonase (cycloisomerase 2 family)
VIASAKPAALVLSADGQHLYAANAVTSYGHLPRGTVEAYSVNPASGRLQLVSREALSLSATEPKHLAISPDGKHLVVAVNGGGAYNLLPIQADGKLGKVSGILKETGSGPHPLQETAKPEMVAFDGAGRVIAVDLGADRVSVLSLEDGLRVTHRADLPEGSGPSRLALDAAGNRVFVAAALDGSVTSFGYDAGRIGARAAMVKTSSVAGSTAALALHPAGTTLYSSHGGEIAAWNVNRATGAMNALPAANVKGVHTLSVAADGKSLLALTESAVVQLRISADGTLGAAKTLARVNNPLSLAIA